MTDTLSGIIAVFGTPLTCYDRAGNTVGSGKAIIQPMTEAAWHYTAGALGRFRRHRFLCLAEKDIPLQAFAPGNTAVCGGGSYEVMDARPVWVGTETTHLWVALRSWEEDEA